MTQSGYTVTFATRSYTDDEKRQVIETICAKVAEGGVGNSFRAAAAELGLSRAMLYKWIAADKELQAMWTEARIWQAHSTAEDAIELADGATKETAHAVRLQVDTRKWYTSKIAPKIYGDRLELTGSNGIPLMPAPSTRVDLSKLSTEQLEQYAALLAIVTVVVEPPQLSAGAEEVTDGR